MRIETPRLVLRSWQTSDREPFADMNADPEVMADLGGPLTREQSDAKFERFVGIEQTHGTTRWALEERTGSTAGRFLGYTGLSFVGDDHSLGLHYEIGWRLIRNAWGQGFAYDAADAALDDALTRLNLAKVYAYTAPTNVRSQAVMRKLDLQRMPELDFSKSSTDAGEWSAMVWVTRF